MIRFRTAALALATALAFGGIAAPAFAGGPEDGKDPAAHRERPSFPMKADDFRARAEKRIAGALSRLDRILERHPVPADVEKQIRADASTAAANVRAAVDKATSDGSVTKDEAKEVRGVARAAMQDARAKYGQYLPEKKGKKGKKGKKQARD